MGTETDLARQILQFISPVMRIVRSEVRSISKNKLTMPQYRILMMVQRGLSQVGKLSQEHGISQPAMSKMVDGLVRRGLLKRVPHDSDRRQIELQLTPKGTALFEAVQRSVQERVAAKVATADSADRKAISDGLKKLAALFILLLVLLPVVPHSYAAGTLTWQACVQEASRQNPELQAARESLQALEYTERGAFSGFLPQISGSLGYSYGTSNSSAIPGGGAPEASGNTSASLTATQNVFAGFQDRARLAQASANAQASRAALDTTRARISYDLKSALANLRFARQSLELNQAIARRRSENLRMVELRFEGGRENKGSALLSKAYLNQANFDVLQARENLAVAREQLARVLGRELPEDVGIQDDIPTQAPPSDLDHQALTDLVVTTPEHRQAQAQSAGSEAAVTLARGAFFPTLGLTATTGRQGPDFFPTSDRERWSIGATLTLPIFSGGKDYYATRSASANFRASQSTLQNTDRQALVKLRQTYVGYVQGVEKLKVDRSFAEAAKARAEIARHKYNNGLTTFDEWDIIENDLINREKAALQSERDRIVAEAAWEQAQGKGVVQ